MKAATIPKVGKMKAAEIPEYCMCPDCALKPPSKKCVCLICDWSEDDDDDVSLCEWDMPSDYIGKLPDRVWDDMEKGQLDTKKPEKKKAETNTKKAEILRYKRRIYLRSFADEYLDPPDFLSEEDQILYYHHYHHRDEPDDQDATEASKQSRTKNKKKMMPLVDKQYQGSKLSRTKKKSKKYATEAEGSKQSRTEKKKMMRRMEKQDQGSKLSRTEKKSQKDTTESLNLELLNLGSKPSTSKRPPWR